MNVLEKIFLHVFRNDMKRIGKKWVFSVGRIRINLLAFEFKIMPLVNGVKVINVLEKIFLREKAIGLTDRLFQRFIHLRIP